MDLWQKERDEQFRKLDEKFVAFYGDVAENNHETSDQLFCRIEERILAWSGNGVEHKQETRDPLVEAMPDSWTRPLMETDLGLVERTRMEAILDPFSWPTAKLLYQEFNHHRQTGSVCDYERKFEDLRWLMLKENPSLSDQYFIQSFVDGLADLIKQWVQTRELATLGATIVEARLRELELELKAAQKSQGSKNVQGGSGFVSKTGLQMSNSWGASSGSKSAVSNTSNTWGTKNYEEIGISIFPPVTTMSLVYLTVEVPPQLRLDFHSVSTTNHDQELKDMETDIKAVADIVAENSVLGGGMDDYGPLFEGSLVEEKCDDVKVYGIDGETSKGAMVVRECEVVGSIVENFFEDESSGENFVNMVKHDYMVEVDVPGKGNFAKAKVVARKLINGDVSLLCLLKELVWQIWPRWRSKENAVVLLLQESGWHHQLDTFNCVIEKSNKSGEGVPVLVSWEELNLNISAIFHKEIQKTCIRFSFGLHILGCWSERSLFGCGFASKIVDSAAASMQLKACEAEALQFFNATTIISVECLSFLISSRKYSSWFVAESVSPGLFQQLKDHASIWKCKLLQILEKFAGVGIVCCPRFMLVEELSSQMISVAISTGGVVTSDNGKAEEMELIEILRQSDGLSKHLHHFMPLNLDEVEYGWAYGFDELMIKCSFELEAMYNSPLEANLGEDETTIAVYCSHLVICRAEVMLRFLQLENVDSCLSDIPMFRSYGSLCLHTRLFGLLCARHCSKSCLEASKITLLIDGNDEEQLEDLDLVLERLKQSEGVECEWGRIEINVTVLTFKLVKARKGPNSREHWLNGNGLPATIIHGDSMLQDVILLPFDTFD